MEELKIGDKINFEGMNYTIQFFHKGAGGSEETARLIDENGRKRDVIKRILIAELYNKVNKSIEASESMKNLEQELPKEKLTRKYNKKEK